MPSLSLVPSSPSLPDESRTPTPELIADQALEEDLQLLVNGHTSAEFRFQPIADLQRATVAGYEALARLPVRAGLPPDLCLQAAGRFGVRLEVEGLLAKGALEARRTLPANTFLCLNVSPSFLASEGWDELFATQDDLFRVVVEITEEQSISDYDSIRTRMAAIRTKGGMVAIDDAGAGFASLKHILELRPGFIKLDRSFITHCDTDRAKSTLIETMGVAANRMDAWIIAEGVETSGELAELVRLGVPLAQGYFLGRPVPAMAELQASGWHDLKTRTVHRQTHEDLLLHAEACATVGTRGEAEELLRTDASVDLVIATDLWKRPVAMIEPDRRAGTRKPSDFTPCPATSDPREALQRALTRTPERRFDPLVLIDGEGRLQGIARIDCMMQGVLQATASSARKPPLATGRSRAAR